MTQSFKKKKNVCPGFGPYDSYSEKKKSKSA